MDGGLVALAYYLSYQLRFDEGVPALYRELFERTIGFVVDGQLFVFALFGLYRHWWRYASQRDYLQIARRAGRDARGGRLVAIVQPRLDVDPARATRASPCRPACSSSTCC